MQGTEAETGGGESKYQKDKYWKMSITQVVTGASSVSTENQ